MLACSSAQEVYSGCKHCGRGSGICRAMASNVLLVADSAFPKKTFSLSAEQFVIISKRISCRWAGVGLLSLGVTIHFWDFWAAYCLQKRSMTHKSWAKSISCTTEVVTWGCWCAPASSVPSTLGAKPSGLCWYSPAFLHHLLEPRQALGHTHAEARFQFPGHK